MAIRLFGLEEDRWTMVDTVKKSGVYSTPDDGTIRSTTASPSAPTGATAGTTTGRASRLSGMPKWVWIVGLVILAMLLWWTFAPSTTGDATAPPDATSTGNGAMPAPAPPPAPAR
ncbi:MAG: hypothetical protein ACK5YI_23650 [Rhodospirillales bacterium]